MHEVTLAGPGTALEQPWAALERPWAALERLWKGSGSTPHGTDLPKDHPQIISDDVRSAAEAHFFHFSDFV